MGVDEYYLEARWHVGKHVSTPSANLPRPAFSTNCYIQQPCSKQASKQASKQSSKQESKQTRHLLIITGTRKEKQNKNIRTQRISI